MIADKKKFFTGFFLLVTFDVVLGLLFSNIFPGGLNDTNQNGLNYLDALYNSISKGSVDKYIPGLQKEAENYNSTQLAVTISMKDEKQAGQTAGIFEKAGAEAKVSGKQIEVKGALGKVVTSCLNDTQSLYGNDGKTIADRYGVDERQVMFNWFTAFKAISKELNRQQKFKDAKMIDTISKKAIELSYNYYKIKPLKISENVGIVIFSLVFYVIYTMWFGFAVLFMFEGWGLKLEH